MQFFVGTSGYSYKEWKGSFYPDKLPAKAMLGYYAGRLSTVEINNTFYRMPKAGVLESWAGEVPDGFQFVLKAPQAITHFKRLKEADEPTQYFLRTAKTLGSKLGPILFQLPPNMKKDLPRLEAFMRSLGADTPSAFEFRHASWIDDEVFACLRANSCALCVADVEEGIDAEPVSTATWGYVRLRRQDYNDEQLQGWINKLRSYGWEKTYVFFKHEDAGTGPRFAARFLELAGK